MSEVVGTELKIVVAMLRAAVAELDRVVEEEESETSVLRGVIEKLQQIILKISS
jgi:hypothetical protein